MNKIIFAFTLSYDEVSLNSYVPFCTVFLFVKGTTISVLFCNNPDMPITVW